MPVRGIIFVGVSVLIFIGTVAFVTAQQEVAEQNQALCNSGLELLWTSASDACINGPQGFICNGGVPPQVEPVGPVSNAVAPIGSLVEVGVVDALHTDPLQANTGSGGVAWLRLPPPMQITGLLIGDVMVRDVAPPDFAAWQSMIVQTAPDTPTTCTTEPEDSLLLQAPPNQSSRIVINGVSLATDGTLMIRTREAETLFVMLSGQARLIALGQERQLLTGHQLSVPYNPDDFSLPVGIPTDPVPLDRSLIENLPVALLDRPVTLPQPGYVATQGQVNLRAAPDVNSALLAAVPAGEIISVLGVNPAHDWYHVRLNNGQTGWMFAELLVQQVGEIQAVYEETPNPPQRFGTLANQGIVQSPAGVNLRIGPALSFGVITTLPEGTQVRVVARSPYSPWVKVNVNGLEGWVALITLDTRAAFEALPIDFDVPPPPVPLPTITPLPGGGHAIPNPDG
ncbi:MAG: SH3 domain-containing protein [Chloroflexi bacterium]|nr:MAG: SH3 domain-containing protein [Chloroflexota bacterium]